MNILQKERIIAKHKSVSEKLSKYKEQLEYELHIFCVENGGHCFDEWQILDTYRPIEYQTEKRLCKFCRKEEKRYAAVLQDDGAAKLRRSSFIADLAFIPYRIASQGVNEHCKGVRVIYKPTNLSVYSSESDLSYYENRKRAIQMIKNKIELGDNQ